MTTDAQTLAYINLFDRLGALPHLWELDKKAANLIAGHSFCRIFRSISGKGKPFGLPFEHCFREILRPQRVVAGIPSYLGCAQPTGLLP